MSALCVCMYLHKEYSAKTPQLTTIVALIRNIIMICTLQLLFLVLCKLTGMDLTQLVKAGRDMGYTGGELENFVKEQQERQGRLLEREREREERLRKREERQREREDELRLTQKETRRKVEKSVKTDDDGQGECGGQRP